jgi:hypothetical protein
MSLRTLHVSHRYADAWIAFDEKDGCDYYYGGTRMVKPSTEEPEVIRILSRLMGEESAFKNKLINIALKQGVVDSYNGRIPEGFNESRVGGARCIVRPANDELYARLQNPHDPAFDSTISEIFEVIGDLLNKHNGVVKLTPDFGRFAGLADILARYTPHVLGIRCEDGGCGGKSSYAATGIITALEELGIADYREKPVTLIGSAGALGSDVLSYLLAKGFKDVVVCDLAYDNGEAVQPPDGTVKYSSKMGVLTEECLKRGGMIIATTYGEELPNSRWELIPPGTMLVLAHNLSVPLGEEGIRIMRSIAAQEVYSIPGQVLTLGGALTSRLEWFWRKSRRDIPFDKALAHIIVRDIEKYLLSNIEELGTSLNTTPCEAMLHFAQTEA